jgi:hypothetical protein
MVRVSYAALLGKDYFFARKIPLHELIDETGI